MAFLGCSGLTEHRPDKCDGTYESYCDKSREVQNMRDILLDANPRLLDYVEEYWKSDRGDDEGFWEHEWNKHGTCINTMEPRCYTDYTRQEEVVDYIQKTVDLFRNLDTYKASRPTSFVSLPSGGAKMSAPAAHRP